MRRLGFRTTLDSLRQARLLTIGTGNGTTTSFTQPPQVTPGTAIYVNDWQGNQLQYSTPRTNILIESQNITGWSVSGRDGTLSNGGTWASGSGTAVELTEGVISSQYLAESNEWSLTPSTTYAISLYFQQGASANTLWQLYNYQSVAGSLPTMAINFNSSTNTITSYAGFSQANLTVLGSGWIKISGIITSTASASGIATCVIVAESPYTGTGAVAFYCGVQVEQNSLATSYIPTTTTTVTVTDYSLSGGNIVFAVAPPSSAAITATV